MERNNDGTFTMVEWKADNQPVCRELRICLSIDGWNKFQKKEFFPALAKYLHTLKTQDSLDILENLED